VSTALTQSGRLRLLEEKVWNWFSFMFGEAGYEIYKGMGVTYSNKELSEEIEAPAKRRLKISVLTL